ncbi:MAG: serine protease AprX [Actinomycetota bacterium]|jgi:serine protease AprX|nr:serine protease AprX [Actinomycetota bacterium]
MRPVSRKNAKPAIAGSTWTCTAPAVDGSSWTREAQQQRGSSWTRTAAILRGSSWTREAKLQDGSSWTRQAAAQDGSSWTRQAQQQRGSSWTRVLPKAVVAGIAAIAMGAAGSPAFASTKAEPAASNPQPGGTFLVRTDAAHAAAVAKAVARLGGTVVRSMAAVGILEVSLPAGRIDALRHTAGVRGATPDGAVKLSTDAYDPSTDAHSLTSSTAAVGLRSKTGYGASGAGVDVAIVDSGVAPVAGLDGANKVIHGPDLSFESQNPNTRYLDTFGHGTHLAGIIAGHDAGVNAGNVAGNDPAFLGVAPDSRILSVKVADSHGNSDVSQVIAGIDWVVEHAQDKRAGLNVRVLNLSFGTDSNASYLKDPLSQAVEVAWQRGIVVVVSAGNRGSELGHLTDPAIDPYVIAVAAGDDDGGVAAFSSIGDGSRNPDVTAPGSHVASLRVPGSYVDSLYGSTASVGGRFIRGSGTSQAAAFVSGMVADMIGANPSISPDEAKYRLRSTATPLAALPNAAGAGLVNANALSATMPVPAALQAASADTSTAAIDTDPTSGRTTKRTDASAWSSVDSTQRFTPSSGDGPLDASRGSYVLVNGQVALTGDKDIFSHPWDGAALAKARSQGRIWRGGVYNGSAWGGSAWGGSAWGGSAWGGSAWGGSAWGGSAWGGSAWGSGSWSGSAWGGSAWGGSAWGGSAWGGSAWGGSAWGGSAWGSVLWG